MFLLYYLDCAPLASLHVLLDWYFDTVLIIG